MSDKDKSNTDENVSIDVSISSNDEIPQKESVIGSFFTSFLRSMGILAIVNVAFNALKKGELKVTKEDTILALGLDAVGATVFGLYDSHKTAERNKHIDDRIKQKADSHVQRYEQENAAKSATPSGQSR